MGDIVSQCKSKNWSFYPVKVEQDSIPLVVPESMMVFAGHPDDELISAGGTILKYAELGCHVTVIVATKGLGGYAREEYKSSISEKRKEEFEQVSKMLHCDFEELGYDSLEVNREIISRFTNLIRDYRPQVILMPHYSDVHRVHRYLSQILREAVYHTATGRAYGGFGREFIPLGVYYYESPSCKFHYVGKEMFVIVDITEQWEEKTNLLEKIYKSQVEVIERVISWTKSTAILRGNEIEAQYGESFIPNTEYVPLRLLLL